MITKTNCKNLYYGNPYTIDPYTGLPQDNYALNKKTQIC